MTKDLTAFLGVDIGTSATKVVAWSANNGKIIACASSEHAILTPEPMQSEQDPEEWWRAACAAISRVIVEAREKGHRVGAVGLSGQMHGLVLLDENALRAGREHEARAIRNAILWNDQRSGAECDEIERAVGGREALVNCTGNAAFPGFTLPKILWVQRHEPQAWRRARTFVLPKDFIRWRLTGELATDVGDASGTLLLDIRSRVWSRDIIGALPLDQLELPPVLEAGAIAGFITAQAAAATGLAAGTPVVTGSGDNQCAAVGGGVVVPGTLACAIGTSGVIVAPCASPVLDAGRHAGRFHAFASATGSSSSAGDWCATGCMLSAGGALQWCKEMLFRDVPYDVLMAEAGSTPRGCDGLVFLPHLSGERCPYRDPSARGAWIGLTSRHTRGHLVRSVIECVCLTLSQILDMMVQSGVRTGSLRISGGAAKVRLWREILASATGLCVETPSTEEGPAFGAALLAGIGVGQWTGAREACSAAVEVTEVIEPEEGAHRDYSAIRKVFDPIFGSVQAHFEALGSI